jgi:hypothetical protein
VYADGHEWKVNIDAKIGAVAKVKRNCILVIRSRTGTDSFKLVQLITGMSKFKYSS